MGVRGPHGVSSRGLMRQDPSKESTMKATGTIETWMAERLTGEVEKLNKRAKRLGVKPMRLKVGNPATKVVKRMCRVSKAEALDYRLTEQFTDSAGMLMVAKDVALEVVDVTLTGEPPKLKGWTLLAQVEPAAGGAMVVNMIDTSAKIPRRFREQGLKCDHCRRNAKRHKVYVVKNAKTNRMKAVGSTCVKDYCGWKGDAQSLFAWAMTYHEIVAAMDPEDGYWGGSATPEAYDLESYLAWCVASVRIAGWVPRWDKMGMRNNHATADDAYESWMAYVRGGIGSPVTKADIKTAKAVLKWARKITKKAQRESDYLCNLAAVCKAGVVSSKHMGIAASAVSAYNREMSRRAREKADAKLKSTFVGELKERLDLKGVTVLDARVFDGHYGTSTLVRFHDARGRVFSTFTSAEIPGAPSVSDMPGMKLSVRGTVKAHVEFRGKKETQLTRCKWDA